jgi:histidinol-phosphate aminotransferase
MLFIANPNNPTGTFVPAGGLKAFLERAPKDVLVVLDEAYNEYLPAELGYDSARWIAAHPNLLVTRTFSKAYGLAGLRVGFGLCDPKIADLLNRVRQPFNVNSLALVAAVAALDDREFVARSCEVNRAGMRQLEQGFGALGLAHIPSVGNFVSFELPRAGNQSQAGAVYEKLLHQGVIVRPVGGYGMPDHLRVTVGLDAENERFLGALAASLNA